MKILLTTAALVLIAASPVASAQAPLRIADNGLITCYYNDAGDYTGADTAQPGAQAGAPVHDGSGDYAWSYTIEAPNGTACPRKLPQ